MSDDAVGVSMDDVLARFKRENRDRIRAWPSGLTLAELEDSGRCRRVVFEYG